MFAHDIAVPKSKDKVVNQAKVEQLEGGIRTLKDRLAAEVALRQEELQEQATSLRDADGAMQVWGSARGICG